MPKPIAGKWLFGSDCDSLRLYKCVCVCTDRHVCVYSLGHRNTGVEERPSLALNRWPSNAPTPHR